MIRKKLIKFICRNIFTINILASIDYSKITVLVRAHFKPFVSFFHYPLSLWIRQEFLFVFTIKQSHFESTWSKHVLMLISEWTNSSAIIPYPHYQLLVIELQSPKVKPPQKLRTQFKKWFLVSCIGVVVRYKPGIAKYFLFFFWCCIKPFIRLAL